MTMTAAALKALIASTRKKMKAGSSYIPDPKVRSALVAEHGLDGVRVLLACEHPKWSGEVFELGAPDCPWPAAKSSAELAKAAFGPLADKLPLLLKRLSNATLTCAVHHHPQAGAPDLGGWFLVYALPERAGPTLWIGGPPDDEPRVDAEGWSLPDDLKSFYRQHNGFGVLRTDNGWTGVGPGLQPSLRLAVPSLGARVKTDDLLRLSRGEGDAGQGGWCLTYTTAPARGRKPAVVTPYSIVDLDDRFGLRGEAVPFDLFGFFDRWMIGDPKDELPLAESDE